MDPMMYGQGKTDKALSRQIDRSVDKLKETLVKHIKDAINRI